MTITKLLCLTAVIGLSYGHVHRTRRQNADMVPMFNDEDGTPIKGMYMEEPSTFRIEPKPCDVQHNSEQNIYDYNCGCNQELGTGRPIGNLILNHTDCTSLLWVFWSELEASLSPKSITFMGVKMTLANQTLDEEANSSIKKLTFANSNFTDLTEDAFKGLKELEELRFIGCNIINISTHAVRDHQKLNTIEIVESIIGKIDENAFINLPAINDFAISFSIIDEIIGRGINLNITGDTHDLPCSRSGRITKELLGTCIESLIERQALSVHEPIGSINMFDTVMGRQIQGARDLDLPSYGNRFLLYQNKIVSIRSNAVTSNAFGFLILGGNYIKLIEATSFNMQLDNPCEISAALFASNNITKLSDKALAGISIKLNSNNSTFISLNKNKFDDVQAQSFQIEKSIQIFSVDENIFKCDCMNLSAFLKDQQTLSSVQAQLKMQIIDKANCTTGVGLKKFKYTCEEFATTPAPTPAPTSAPTPAPHSGTKSTFSHSNLTNVVVTGFIMILINKIVP